MEFQGGPGSGPDAHDLCNMERSFKVDMAVVLMMMDMARNDIKRLDLF
jgi:hypothetical protein